MVQLSRRQLLVLGGAATAVAALAYPALRQVGSYPEPGVPLRELSPKEAAVYRVVGDFLLPPGSDLPGSGGDDETLMRIDELHGGLPPHHARMLSALPHVIEHGPVLDRFGARSLTWLGAEEREAYLMRWAAGQTLLEAQLWSALKLVYGLTYFERMDVRRAMGLTPYCGEAP
jgi:hypothetical protein